MPPTIRPIEGTDRGSATLERFIESVILDPGTWASVRTFVFVLLGLFVFNLMRVNLPITPLAGYRLGGTLCVVFEGQTIFVKLGRLHLWRNMTRFNKRITVDGKPATLRIKVLSSREPGKVLVRYKLDLPKGVSAQHYARGWFDVEVKRDNNKEKPVTRTGGKLKFYFM